MAVCAGARLSRLLGSYLGVLLDYLETSRPVRLFGVGPEKVLGPIDVRLGLGSELLGLGLVASGCLGHCPRRYGHGGGCVEQSRGRLRGSLIFG